MTQEIIAPEVVHDPVSRVKDQKEWLKQFEVAKQNFIEVLVEGQKRRFIR